MSCRHDDWTAGLYKAQYAAIGAVGTPQALAAAAAAAATLGPRVPTASKVWP